MTEREKALTLAAYDYIKSEAVAPENMQFAYGDFINGAKWAFEYVDKVGNPITPEFLKKNGFELKPDGWLWCEHAEIEDQNYIFIQFRKGCEEVRLVELNFVNNVLSKFERIKYVYELQNILRLCGIGKEIEP